MRVNILYLFIFVSTAWAYFTAQQLEIIDLHHRLQPKNLKGTKNPQRTFYSILSVEKNASDEELEKAYKKLSRKWHPDKFIRADVKERKKAERKFESLSLIMTILRDVERRKNYDYFVKNGFPIWDKSRSRYIFQNRSKPNFILIASFILVVISGLQFLMLKMNKSQSNKRVNQILRDVKWKADNMTKQDVNNNKIMELPDDYGLGSNISTNYIVDDRLVTYCGKIFIVKPDSTVLLYNNDDINVDDQQQMNDFVTKIIDSGMFSLYGVQKRTRKEKRFLDKNNNTDVSSIVDKFVEFKQDDGVIRLSDWFVIKLVLFFWRITLGKLVPASTPSNSKSIPQKETESSNEPIFEKAEIKHDADKMVLPNGKVLHSRKR